MHEISTEPRKESSALRGKYPRSESAFDESLADGGNVRPHYTKLFQTLGELGEAELKRRADTCLQFIHEQGIYYNVYGDPRGTERPWQMDPIPLAIAPDEWMALAGYPYNGAECRHRG